MKKGTRIRYIRLMVFFDLPVTTATQRKRYAQFRQNLIKEGFLMLQQSVYTKLVINDAAASGSLIRLRKFSPHEGLVQVLKVTEKQYATIACITGQEITHAVLDSMEEFVVL